MKGCPCSVACVEHFTKFVRFIRIRSAVAVHRSSSRLLLTIATLPSSSLRAAPSSQLLKADSNNARSVQQPLLRYSLLRQHRASAELEVRTQLLHPLPRSAKEKPTEEAYICVRALSNARLHSVAQARLLSYEHAYSSPLGAELMRIEAAVRKARLLFRCSALSVAVGFFSGPRSCGRMSRLRRLSPPTHSTTAPAARGSAPAIMLRARHRARGALSPLGSGGTFVGLKLRAGLTGKAKHGRLLAVL